MKYIKTGTYRSDAKRHYLVIVDDDDFEKLNKFHWFVDKFGATQSYLGSGKNKPILMHRFLMKPPDDMEIDHIDGNRLNNQRSNLRFANSSQNKCNRGPRKDCKSGFKGVSWHKQLNKWTARIQTNKKNVYLGVFNDIKDAILAYNDAAIKYHGQFAFINKI